jgi:hypothetical protein
MDSAGVSGYGGGVASDCKSDPLVVNGAGSNPASRTTGLLDASGQHQQMRPSRTSVQFLFLRRCWG